MTTTELNWTENDAPLRIVQELRKAGHEAWLAGGCVRDLLLGRIPKDYDIATSAQPVEVQAVFKRTVPVQPELGVTLVLWGENRLEVTAFRSEGPYLDGRRPSHVAPATSAQDVQRRDFTINGLLMDPETGEVIDHVGGVADLRAGILRCIGNPEDRFNEDHLRILRAVRFAVRFGMEIHTQTFDAMQKLSSNVSTLSGERIHEEFERMFAQASFAPCLELLRTSGVLGVLFPELAEHFEQDETYARLQAWLQYPTPHTVGVWCALLGAPLSPWWNTPDQWFPTSPISKAQEALLSKLRCSNAEIEGARLVWSSWPVLFTPEPRKRSILAPLVRHKAWQTLLAFAQQYQNAVLPPQSGWTERLQEEVSSIPKQVPAVGNLLLEAGIPKGPKLGQAIRLMDLWILDDGRQLDQGLIDEVVKTILESE